MNRDLINPFNLSDEELLEYAMNPDKSAPIQTAELHKHSLLGVAYTPYNPDIDMNKEYMETFKGAKVPEFDEKLKFKPPRFRDLTPDEVLVNLNVKEQQDAFRREQEMKNALNFTFAPARGNTPAERAKNENINKLLAEIDTFAIQYNLSNTQKEQLKTQVLSSHLGEYIQKKNTLEKMDKDREQAEAMALARGENKPEGAPFVNDPYNGMDENNMRIGAGDAQPEGEAPALAGAGGGDSTVTGNPAGNRGEDVGVTPVRPFADMGRAVEPLEGRDVDEQARGLVANIGGMSEGELRTDIVNFFATTTKKSIRDFVTIYRIKKADRSRKQQSNAEIVKLDVIYPTLLSFLGYGTDISPQEITPFVEILNEARKILKKELGF